MIKQIESKPPPGRSTRSLKHGCHLFLWTLSLGFSVGSPFAQEAIAFPSLTSELEQRMRADFLGGALELVERAEEEYAQILPLLQGLREKSNVQ